MTDLEAKVQLLSEGLTEDREEDTPPSKPVRTRTRWAALGVIVLYTVVFGGALSIAILNGPADGDGNFVALVGAIVVAVSVIFTNVSIIINEWESPKKLGFEGWMAMGAISCGAIGSVLVIMGLL